MGWVATVAGALVATMFVYNWFNTNSASAQSDEEEKIRQDVTSKAEQNGADVRTLEENEAVELPQDQEQVTATKSAETRLSNNGSAQNDVHTMQPLQSSTASQSQTTMPPPPLPPTIMAPPPVPTLRSSSPPRLKPPTIGRSPAAAQPPRPNNSNGNGLRPPPSAASSLRVPVTKPLPNASMAPTQAATSSTLPSTSKSNTSRQVTLEPGHSPLDWAALTTNPRNSALLRGKDAPATRLLKVTPSQLKIQNGRRGRDAWTVFQGKVYNVTPYVAFHPGGKGEILRGAGKDSAKLFLEVHPWVNWDGMLGECCVGILVGEGEGEGDEMAKGEGSGNTNTLDEMD